MDTGSNSERKPFGENIRNMINEALADERREKIQSDLVNNFFEQAASQIDKIIGQDYTKLFNEAARRAPNDRNPFLIDALSATDQKGQPKYTPIKRIPMPIVTTFTEFTAADIKAMPGYIKLHEAAREENVALRIVGLTVDESKSPSPFPLPPILIIDASKSYEDGAIDNSNFYPNLPPPKVNFDRSKPQDFDL